MKPTTDKKATATEVNAAPHRSSTMAKQKKQQTKKTNGTKAAQPHQLAHTNQSTFTGELDHPVQINVSSEQKTLLIKRAKEVGMPLAAYIRSAALEKARA